MIHDPNREADEARHFAKASDVDEFVDMLEKFERGDIDAAKFREFRLTRGVYGQRQPDQHMIRLKIPAGVATAAQLRLLAEIAREKSRGFGHVTTRQNVQFHAVTLDDTEEVLRRFADAGVTTREACGNTVRNITACAMAGVCRDERFDVTPYADALTRFFLRHPETQNMPRKFKIAFSGCGSDCAFGAIHDIGFIARRGPEGEPGFKIVAGGGLATHPTPAVVAWEFLPVEEMARAALAIVRIQQQFGERKNRGRARLKYTIKRLGPDEFLERVHAEFVRTLQDDVPRLVSSEDRLAERSALSVWSAPEGDDPYARWASSNVTEQRQPGRVAVSVRLPLGDITATQFDELADLAERVSEGAVRFTVDQNVLLRSVPAERLREVHAALSAMGLAEEGVGAIDNATSCPGADTCNLAITHSRRLAKGLGEALPKWRNQLTDGTTVKVSGCPNSCGQHHIAAIGFHGSTARAMDRVIPVYQLHLGGGVDEEGATFGRVLNKIPVHRVGDAVDRLLASYERERTAGQTPLAYFRSLEKERVTDILGDCLDLTEVTMKEEDFQDLETGVPFRVVVGKGECAS